MHLWRFVKPQCQGLKVHFGLVIGSEKSWLEKKNLLGIKKVFPGTHTFQTEPRARYSYRIRSRKRQGEKLLSGIVNWCWQASFFDKRLAYQSDAWWPALKWRTFGTQKSFLSQTVLGRSLGRSWLGYAALKDCLKCFAGTTKHVGLEETFGTRKFPDSMGICPGRLSIEIKLIMRDPTKQIHIPSHTYVFASCFEPRPGQVEEKLQNQKHQQNMPLYKSKKSIIYIYMYYII